MLSALHRVIVMEAGGQKTLPSLCSHRARVSSVFSPPTPHNGSGEMGRTSDTPTGATTGGVPHTMRPSKGAYIQHILVAFTGLGPPT